jgi:hypothetical protein
MLLDVLGRPDYALEDYAGAKRSLKLVEDAKAQTDTEFTLVLLSPLSLSIALALRITKVAGEIVLERRPSNTGSPNTLMRPPVVKG